jgi:hypothetical protein
MINGSFTLNGDPKCKYSLRGCLFAFNERLCLFTYLLLFIFINCLSIFIIILLSLFYVYTMLQTPYTTKWVIHHKRTIQPGMCKKGTTKNGFHQKNCQQETVAMVNQSQSNENCHTIQWIKQIDIKSSNKCSNVAMTNHQSSHNKS